jgi:PBP1b-binding outer membrane lipoprotein LpoB
MNTISKVKTMMAVVLLALLAVGCNKELDEAPVLTYNGQANMTIDELLSYHTVGSVDSYSEIPEGTIITGVVTSSDQEGNCYKYLTIQDETGAIMIKVDDSHLYPKYSIGQRIFVECGDMVIGDYRKNKQLGFWVDGTMTGISSSREDMYLYRDGVCGAEPEALVITSKNQLDESMYNRLVKLEGCHFEDGGRANYCDAGTNTSRNIVMGDNTEIVLRTSSYATFANTLLPEGEGDIYGILTIYNTTPQLIIRSLADVRIGGGGGVNPADVQTLYSVDLTQNPLEGQGWSVQGDEGWFYWTGGPAFAIQNQASTMIDSWLVSPAIGGLSGYENVFVAVEDVANASATGMMEMYYSTSFNGTSIDENGWVRFNKLEALPAEVTSSSNFRIAFRYRDANGANWRINSVQVKGTPVR